jgi:hypothetical protein
MSTQNKGVLVSVLVAQAINFNQQNQESSYDYF